MTISDALARARETLAAKWAAEKRARKESMEAKSKICKRKKRKVVSLISPDQPHDADTVADADALAIVPFDPSTHKSLLQINAYKHRLLSGSPRS